jgi:hypothetical protein
VSETVKKTWSALNGSLVFDISFHRDWRVGVPGTPAIAEVSCQYEPVETCVIEISRHKPTDFRLRFRSGCSVEGVLQELGHILVSGGDSLGVFADLRFNAPRSAENHFEGLIATCPILKHA